MSSEDSSEQKSTKISLTGDPSCSHCQTDDKRLRDNTKAGYEYEYIDVNSDKGQENLKSWGVKENESVDIPIIKTETCSWTPNPMTDQPPLNKKCKTSDWKEEYWSDIESGKLPSEVL